MRAGYRESESVSVQVDYQKSGGPPRVRTDDWRHVLPLAWWLVMRADCKKIVFLFAGLLSGVQ